MKKKSLDGVTDRDAEFARLESLQRRVADEITSFRGSDRLERDLLHEHANRSQR